RAACHHVLGADRVRGVVEVNEVPAAHIDSADAEAGFSGIDPVEVDEALQRGFEELSFVKTRRFQRAVRVQPRNRLTQREEAMGAADKSEACADMVKAAAREVSLRS